MATPLRHFFSTNVSFSYEALRAAGYANNDAADLAKVIAICSLIPAGDEKRWLLEWRAAGDRAVENAESASSSIIGPVLGRGLLSERSRGEALILTFT